MTQPLTPPPISLRQAYSVTNTTFEDVHDAHVRAVLDGLARRALNPETAEVALFAMLCIAEAECYTRG